MSVIFAAATAPGRAAVAVLRLSGRGCGALLATLAGPLPAPRRASLRRLRHGGEVLDHALVLWFPGPASYTGEDTVELHLHGGPAVMEAVAGALVQGGARPAEPGEFTRRAFLNDRLDLTAAEGIADLIAAETETQRRQALRQADGALARRQADWAARLTRLLARQEAMVEFEEEDLGAGLEDGILADAAALCAEMAALLAEGDRGERLREGVTVALLGAPNAGKSSLLNALAGREAAIVSARAGTTRDVVEVRLVLAGVPVLLADTAGLRETTDEIETEGVRRALARAEAADLRLLLFAADALPDAATLALCGAGGLVLGTKADLGRASLPGALALSTCTGEGLPALLAWLEAEVGRRAAPSGLTRPRHRAALGEAVGWLEGLSHSLLPELRAETLRSARQALARLTGAADVEAVLDAVFLEFCIGK